MELGFNIFSGRSEKFSLIRCCLSNSFFEESKGTSHVGIKQGLQRLWGGSVPGAPEESSWRFSWLDWAEQREVVRRGSCREIEVGELDCCGEGFGSV